MLIIPDDPIIRSMERTGYPPWFGYEDPDDDLEDEDEEEEEPDC